MSPATALRNFPPATAGDRESMQTTQFGLAATAVVLGLSAAASAVVTQTFDPADVSVDFFQDFAGFADVDYTAAVSAGPVDLNPALPATATAVGSSTFSGDFAIDDEALDLFLTGSDISAITLTFDSPLLAYGAETVAANPAPSIFVEIDGTTFNLVNGFQGFVSDTPFTEVTYLVATPAIVDFFTVDNIVATYVPEPASASVLGLVGLAMLRRRR